MPQQLSRRQQAIEAYKRGEGTLEELAARFRIAAAFLGRFLGFRPAQPSLPSPTRREESTSVASAPSPPRAPASARVSSPSPAAQPPDNDGASPADSGPAIKGPALLEEQDLEALRELTREQPTASLKQLRQALGQRRGRSIGFAALRRSLTLLGLKKRRAQPVAAPNAEVPATPPAPTTTHPRYRSEHRRLSSTPEAYPSDLTDAEWAQIQPLLQPTGRGRPWTQDRRRILDALFYIGRTGCQWRMLPHDYPPWQTVASCFYRWQQGGVLQKVYEKLRGIYRESVGKQEQPSAGIIDSQTVKTTEKGGRQGLMEAKR